MAATVVERAVGARPPLLSRAVSWDAGIDGVSRFFGIRWDSPSTARLTIRPELINAGDMLSGVATYALVDYTMGSALWAETTDEEAIATVNIAINYVQTATEGDVICTTTVDRRNRTAATLRSEVRDEDGRLMATAIGSYAIFPRRRARR
jgi:acyl-CoA thioesterase